MIFSSDTNASEHIHATEEKAIVSFDCFKDQKKTHIKAP